MIPQILKRLFRDPMYLDPEFYLWRNPDVAMSGLDPEHHYLHFGMREGRAPNAWIDRLWYKPKKDQSAQPDTTDGTQKVPPGNSIVREDKP